MLHNNRNLVSKSSVDFKISNLTLLKKVRVKLKIKKYFDPKIIFIH